MITYLCDELGGDWLLTGGSMVRLFFDANRGTEDIDLVRIRHDQLSDEAAKDHLFRFVMSMGLGPENVNSAVEPFIRRVPDWEREIVLVRKGKQGQVFRPNLTLFAYLKLSRGTEIDQADIRTMLLSCRDEEFDENRFLQWADNNLKQRYRKLQRKLGL